MRRNCLTCFALLGALLLGVVVAVPWWLPGAASMVAGRYGVTFRAYQRLSYGRFVVGDVEIRRPGVTVRIDHLEADTPVLWGWRHLAGRQAAVRGGNWTVAVQPQSPASPTGPTGWVPLRARLFRIADALQRWIPDATTGSGVVHWPGGEIEMQAAHWHDRSIDVQSLRYHGITAEVAARFDSANDRIALAVKRSSLDAEGAFLSEGGRATGHFTWWQQQAVLDADFDHGGWLPATAMIRADEIELPAERLRLGAMYRTVSGRIRINWAERRMAAEMNLRGEPLNGKPAPPLAVQLRASGDAQEITVDDLQVNIPGGVATLTAPVTIGRTGLARETAAQFQVQWDLAQQPWLAAHGVLRGGARFLTRSGGPPVVQFDATATDVNLPGAAIRQLALQGELAWPELRLSELGITGIHGEKIQARGGWDFHSSRVRDASVQGVISRQSVERWLPRGLNFETLSINAQASGPIARLAHSGRVAVPELSFALLQPAALEFSWNGTGPTVDSLALTGTIGGARILAHGTGNATAATITNFSLSAGNDEIHLSRPARIAWQPQMEIDDLHLTGAGGVIDAALLWGKTGRVDVTVHGFSSRWLGVLTELREPAWQVPSLALTGHWENGPMTFTAAGEVTFELAEHRTASVTISTRGGPDGLVVEALHAIESGHAVVNATGRLPMAISPGSNRMFTLAGDGAVQLEATTVPNAAFWQQLAAMTGMELRDPEMVAHVSGSWTQPKGDIEFKVAHAAMDPKRFTRPIPTIDNVDLRVTGAANAFNLERLTFTVAGQRVRASGRVALDRNIWPNLTGDPLAYLRKNSDLRIEVPNAEVAMFSRYLPAALAPAGTLQADIRFNHGALAGSLHLRDAASRPLGPLGVLQQLDADVDFSDHRVILRKVSGMAGGQPVILAGAVELPAGDWGSGAATEPRYDVTLRGQNLPFVRQSGLLVRGDLDLRLQTPTKGPPAISGKVKLRDSLFLTDVRAYLPHGGTTSASRRPPYFSVETVPLNIWTLSVDVSGTRFIRIRTPVFVGVASTRFHLGGTLGDPRAIGEATLDEGLIRMPFASFDVTQGAVRLTEEQPYEPTVYIRGAGRHYGYDLTMEVTGRASAPKITFISSPALAAEQVLLMVMTGAAPANELNSSLTRRAVQIGAFVGQSLIGSLTGGSVQPDRLSIESGEKVSEQGKETYAIEYKLNDRWSLTGEYDEFDEYNAGFKWRIAPKKLPR